MNIDVGIVRVHLAREHAAELELAELLFEALEVRLNLGDCVFVVLLGGKVQEVGGIVETGRQLVESYDNGFERGAFLSKRLGSLGVIPDVGLFELALNLGQALLLLIVVKDTPLTRLSVHEGRRLPV